MKNKSILLKKIIIALCIFIGGTLLLGTTFYAIGSSEDTLSTWGDYIIEWNFPVLIFIVMPMILGMENDTDLNNQKWIIWIKLLSTAMTYAFVLFVMEWAVSEPKDPRMDVYKHACMIIIPIACFICYIGHVINKILQKKKDRYEKYKEEQTIESSPWAKNTLKHEKNSVTFE